MAARNGDTEIVKYMLKSGIKPPIQTQHGWASLHWVASYGHTDYMMLLLEAGAEPNIVSDQSVTQPDLAIQAGQGTMIDLLHSVGAKTYQENGANAGHGTNKLKKDGSWVSANSPNRNLPNSDEAGRPMVRTTGPETQTGPN